MVILYLNYSHHYLQLQLQLQLQTLTTYLQIYTFKGCCIICKIMMSITRTSTATTTTTTASDISQMEIKELEIEPRPKSTDNNSCSCSSSSSSSLIPSNTTKSNHIHKPIARRNIPIELKDDNIDALNPTEKENNMTKCIPNTKIDSSSSSTNSTSTPLIPSDIHRACKRSSSSSNDLIYERDRFRARLKSLMIHNCIIINMNLHQQQQQKWNRLLTHH